MRGAGLEEWRQLPGGHLPDLPDLPGGDLLAGSQAAVLGHQGDGDGPGVSPRQDDGVEACLDGAVHLPLLLEAEALPALSSLPGEQLRGGGRAVSPYEEQALAGDS